MTNRLKNHPSDRKQVCNGCSKVFIKHHHCERYCSPECSQATKSPTPPELVGVYVYLWFRPEETVPFYVGLGINNRAWRATTYSKVVKIVRHNLTREGAMLVEASLVKAFRLCGVELLNGPQKLFSRQEREPLTKQ